MNLRESFPELEALYGKLPGMPCISCGLCCVTPHVTMVEFAYILNEMFKAWPREQMIAFVSSEMEPENRYPGNFKCKLQTGKGLCGLYAGRPLMCRLEGMPVLDRMGVREYQICPYIEEGQMETKIAPEDIDSWVQKVFDLTKQFYPVYEEPYWLSSLNLECWFALALDSKISQPFVLTIRNRIRRAFDLDFLEPHYADRTRLAEKLDLVDLFFEEAERKKRPRHALRALQKMSHEFPCAGSYFEAESTRYLELMRRIERQRRRRK